MASKLLLIALLGVSLTLIKAAEIKIESIGYKKNITLKCNGISDPEFFLLPKVEDVVVVSKRQTVDEKPATEAVKEAPKEKKLENLEGIYFIEENSLTIYEVKGEEIKGKISCKSKSDPTQTNTFVFSGIKPFLYKPDKLSLTETEGDNAKISCRVLYGSDELSWTWLRDSVDILENVEKTEGSTNRYKVESTDKGTTLTIDKVTEADKGMYECVLKNKHGEHSEKINLRVKSALAALWPFLGIVAEVFILCVIILSYETRCGKKKKSEEDESEQAQNLMGRDGAQTSDVKKRTAKA